MTVSIRNQEEVISYESCEAADFFTLVRVLNDATIVDVLERQFDKELVGSAIDTTHALFLHKTASTMPGPELTFNEHKIYDRLTHHLANLALVQSANSDSTRCNDEDIELRDEDVREELEPTRHYTSEETNVVIAALRDAARRLSYMRPALDSLTRLAPIDERQGYKMQLQTILSQNLDVFQI